MRTFAALVQIAIFALACLLPGLGLLRFEGDTHSVAENRNLAGFPEKPSSLDMLQEWPTRFEQFVADHFGFRSRLVSDYNFLHIIAGISPHPRVVAGKSGWLFLEQTRLTDSNRGAIPFTAQALDQLVDSFLLRDEYLESKGKQLVVLPLPDKNSLYPEFLPGSVRFVGPSRFSQFRNAVRASGLTVVDALQTLQTAKQAGELVYFQTDSHWNCRGAWFAYLALMQKIRESGYVGGTVLQASDVDFVRPEPAPPTDIVRNLLNLEGRIPESNSYVCRVRNPAEIKASRPSDGEQFDYVYAAPPGREHRRYEHLQPIDASRVLVYRDSYANALLPYLVHSFNEVIYAAPGKTMGFEAADIERYNPDLVIYEFVERALYYPPGNNIPGWGKNPVTDDTDDS